MSPLYEYRCEQGHVHERLRAVAERGEPAECPDCGRPAAPILSAAHVPPDGIYSYAPNIGTEEAWERKQRLMKEREEKKRGQMG